MKLGRVHWFTPDELDEDQLVLYKHLVAGPLDSDPNRHSSMTDEQGRLFGAHNPRLLSPKLGRALEDVIEALRFHVELPTRQIELCCLETGRSEQSNTEWLGHATRAGKFGFSDDDLAAILNGEDVESLSDDEKLVRRVTQALTTDGDLSDELFAEAEEALGPRAIFEIVSIVGQYQHTALALRVWRTPLRDGATPVFEEKQATPS